MERKFRSVALAQKVLAVAVVNYNGGSLFDWAVYVDAVAGIDHEQEKQRAAEEGCKQSKEMAKFLFPEFDIELYRT